MNLKNTAAHFPQLYQPEKNKSPNLSAPQNCSAIAQPPPFKFQKKISLPPNFKGEGAETMALGNTPVLPNFPQSFPGFND